MGAEIFKDSKGGCRIAILVLLLVSIILCGIGFAGDKGEYASYWGFGIFVLICVLIWYILLAADAFPYNDVVRKCDGIGHVVLGVLVTVLGLAAFIHMLVQSKGCDLGGDYQVYCWLYVIGQVIYTVAGIVMIILGVKVIKGE